jgi:hypothetical protein
MARDYLLILATLAPSERAFSDSGNTLTKKRCKLSPQSIRIVVCLRSWGLYKEEEDSDTKEEEFDDNDDDNKGNGDKARADSSTGKTPVSSRVAVFSTNII